LYRFFHLLAAASSLDVNRKQLIVLFVGARSAVAWYDQIGNVLRETSFWAEFVVFGSLEYNKYFFPFVCDKMYSFVCMNCINGSCNLNQEYVHLNFPYPI
jgi:hypothetical protein